MLSTKGFGLVRWICALLAALAAGSLYGYIVGMIGLWAGRW